MSLLRAKEKDLQQWSGFAAKARYDYDSVDYRLEEMLNNDFFGLCCSLLKKGDLITITDCEDQIVTVRVDSVDKTGMQVWLSAVERQFANPIVAPRQTKLAHDPGLTYRWRTTRAGGHSIVTRTGEVVAINFGSREHAQRAVEQMYETGNLTPPYGHEPTAQFVKGARVFRPGDNHGHLTDGSGQSSDVPPRG